MVIYVELPGSSDACEDDISRHICGFSKLNNIDTTRSSQGAMAQFSLWLSLASCPGESPSQLSELWQFKY